MAYIEREAAIKVLRGKAIAKYPASFYMGLFAASNELDDIPASDVAPVRHGRWIYAKTYYDADECNCSLCGQLMTTAIHKRMNFCPNCGAKMDLSVECKQDGDR